MSEVLVTDTEKLFMSKQWTSFCFHMQCCCNISTAFHLQTDDQTERQNQFLKVYLYIFVDEQQEDWVKLLFCAEFFYNNFIHAATEMTPFQLNLEWDPQMSLSRSSIRHSHEQIRLYADTQHLQDQIITAQKQLQQINKMYVSYYNQHWMKIIFKKGNLVLINEKNISVNKQIKKLHWKKLSLFKIQHVLNWLSYELDLSEDWNIYNVFNVTLLESFWGTHYVFSTLTEKDLLLNQNNEWKVKVIINSWI